MKKRFIVTENKVLRGYWDVYDTRTKKPLPNYTGILSKTEAEYNADVLNRMGVA